MPDKNPVSFEDTSIAFSSRTDKELRRMQFLFSSMSREFLTKIGTFFVKTALNLKLPVKAPIKNLLFRQFCGGETIEECQATIQSLSMAKIHTILDYAVEGENRESVFDETARKILETIKLDSESTDISFSVFKMTGLAPFELLEKVQKGENLNVEDQQGFDRLRKRVELLCQTANDQNVSLMVDAEESWIQDAIDALVLEMMKKFNKERPVLYNTFQMYRADSMYNLKRALEAAKYEKFKLGVKLVRGAYMEKERERANELRYASPIFSTKKETDEAYDEALNFCIENRDLVYICCGSHNEKSNYHLCSLMEKRGMQKNDQRVWFSQLYGMSDHISYNLAAAGYNVAKYVPYGPVEAVIPYLFRRAEENKAITGGSRELEMVKKEIKRRKLKG
jgi:proline dehydrogenase